MHTFFYPDYTVGPGISPDHAACTTWLCLPLVGCTTDRELPLDCVLQQSIAHPAPKVNRPSMRWQPVGILSCHTADSSATLIIAFCKGWVNGLCINSQFAHSNSMSERCILVFTHTGQDHQYGRRLHLVL